METAPEMVCPSIIQMRPKAATLTSAPDPVVHVGDTGLPFDDPGPLQLDVLGTALVEETAPLAEERRDEMDPELVEDAGSECELRGSGAVDQHVLVARGPLGLGHRRPDVGTWVNQRPLPLSLSGSRAMSGRLLSGAYPLRWPLIKRVTGLGLYGSPRVEPSRDVL
jgi:hypothetical protein